MKNLKTIIYSFFVLCICSGIYFLWSQYQGDTEDLILRKGITMHYRFLQKDALSEEEQKIALALFEHRQNHNIKDRLDHNLDLTKIGWYAVETPDGYLHLYLKGYNNADISLQMCLQMGDYYDHPFEIRWQGRTRSVSLKFWVLLTPNENTINEDRNMFKYVFKIK